ncbi:MAG: hypothetical protein DRP51_06760 [Candidatus Zixiibacteriota bacterium]|nr:MAG: hypothetical protein DRP51_06760 [candidate division Zixibacteria bacterium]
MPYRPVVSRLRPIICTVFLLIVCSAGMIHGEDMTRSYDLEVFVGDTTGSSGEQNSAISIYLKNYTDTIAGFNLWIQLSRPDIMEFQTNLDIIEYEVHYIYTEWDPGDPLIPIDSVVASPYWVCTDWSGPDCIDSVSMLGYYKCLEYSGDDCIDSVFVEWVEGVDPVYTELKEAFVGNIDTVGTLVQGWEMITTRSLTETGQDMLITAFADQAGPPPDTRTPGIGYPQYGVMPLIKILGDIFPMDDTVTNRTASVMINASIIDYFGFSDEEGNSIGVISEDIEHYTYFMCEQWLVQDEVCMYWNRVMESECPPEPDGCDSVHVDTILHGYLDVDECCNPAGDSCIREIEEWQCPDQFDGTGVWHAGSIRIVYGSITVETGTCGEIDGVEGINILDIVYLINYKYKGGPPPENLNMADVDNCSGDINILDVVYLINYKYKLGPDPSCCGK